MVLAQLGTSITRALHQMSNATIVDQSVLNACLNDIVRAMLQGDVNIRLVKKMQDNIKRIVNFEEMAAGINKRRIIKQISFQGLILFKIYIDRHSIIFLIELVIQYDMRTHEAVFNELCRMLDAGNPSFRPRGKQVSSCLLVCKDLGKPPHVRSMHTIIRKKAGNQHWFAQIHSELVLLISLSRMQQKLRFHSMEDPVKIAVEGVERFRKENHDLIIIDTSGRHKQEAALFEQMHQVSEATKPDLVIFVMDSSIGQAAYDQAQAFKQSLAVGAVIITKMDGHAKGGGALSAVVATKSPVILIGTGEHMHEFEVFDAKSFVRWLLGMGDLSGLKDKIQEIVLEDQQSELLKKISEGTFTLRVMHQQFQNACKAGPISQVFSMLPGFSVASIPEGLEK